MSNAFNPVSNQGTQVSVTGPEGVVSADISGTDAAFPPVPTFLAIEADFAQAYDTTAFAVAHAQAADGFIAQLGQLAAQLVPPQVIPSYPQQTSLPQISTPVAPSLEPLNYVAPVAPLPFSGTLDITTTFPTFDAQPPQLLFPNAPATFNQPLPTSPAIDTNFSYPAAPTVDIPPPPPLLSISVQPFDGVNFPVFDAASPVLTLAAPQVVGYLASAPYTDGLLSSLLDTLQSRLGLPTGLATGLPAAVEENIWNRAREREYRQLADRTADLDRMETMGYALPPGAYVDARIKLSTDFGYTTAGLSRDVMIKQAELEQSNIQKSMELAVSIESKLIDYANENEQRKFDACKYATEAGVSIYNAGVQAYDARVNAYKASVDVYTAQIAGARAQVEIYTAEIEAEKLKVEANSALIEQYKAIIQAALASVQVYTAEIEVVKTMAEVENLKISIFGEQVKAYAAEVTSYTSTIEAYKALLEAEQTKEQVYSTQAQVYGTLVDAQSKTINANIEIFKARLAEKVEEYDAFKALVESEAENVKAIAAYNTSVAAIYSAEVSGTSAYNEALVSEYKTQSDIAAQLTQIGVSAAQANGQLYLTAKSVATDAAKVGATVEAQIASSALGTVTWATHRSRQDSLSAGTSQSNSMGRSISVGLSGSTSVGYSKSDSNQTSNSFSSSTSTVHQIQSVE